MAEPSNLLGPSVVPLLARSIWLVGYYIWSASVWGSMILRLKQLEHRKLLGKEILRCDWQTGTYANSWILIDLSLSPTSSPKSLVFFGDYHFSAEYHFLWIINNNHPKSSARVNQFGLIFAYLIIFDRICTDSQLKQSSCNEWEGNYGLATTLAVGASNYVATPAKTSEVYHELF